MNVAEHPVESIEIPWYAEPYRLFFPVGALAAIVAALLWPVAEYWPILGYPLEAHRYLMLQVYLGAFAMGFLGTAGPRMLDAPPLNQGESSLGWLLLVAAGVAHIIGHAVVGHLLFGVAWYTWGWFIVKRWQRRKDLPPPGLPLVALTWVAGWSSAFGLALVGAEVITPVWQPYLLVLHEKVFPVGMILGVGVFLLPRFWSVESPHAFPEMRVPDRRWWVEFRYAAAMALLLLVGACLQARGHGTPWNLILAGAATLYVFWRIRPFTSEATCSPLGWMARLSLLGLIAGLWLEPLVTPAWRIGAVHLYFLGGVAMILFAVGSRVIWGHSGQQMRARGSGGLVTLLVTGLLLTLLARLCVDLFPVQRIHFLAVSAGCWVLTHLLWALKVLPGVFRVEPD